MTDMKVSAFVITLTLVLAVTARNVTCPDGDTCSCCYLGNKYTPNVTDECESFTQAFQGAEYSVSCSPDLAFDLQTCVCEWSNLVQCKECNS